MRNEIRTLFSLSWTNAKFEGIPIQDQTIGNILSLQDLHKREALRADRIPVCPTLAHGYRINGRKFPKSWTTAYKMTQKMVKKMEQVEAYQNYLIAYKRFIKDIIVPLFVPYTTAIVYQCPPTLRVHMPGYTPTISLHCDADYARHETSEVNFWIPFTKVFGNNTLWCESAPGRDDFQPFELESGEGMRFNGNTCRHFTKPNDTDYTRVSFDFRVIPKDLAVRPEEYLGKIGDYHTEVMSCMISDESANNTC